MIARLLPLTVRPKYLAMKHRLRQSFRFNRQGGRDLIIFLLSSLLMYWLYQGTLRSLQYIQNNAALAYLHPSLTLGLGLILLSGMLIFSNCAGALSSLFLSNDLDLLLASPTTPFRFFIGKLTEITLSSSWMVLVFSIPVLSAFGKAYHASPEYYLWAFLLLIPYFLIPATLAVLLVTIFAAAIPASRTKPILLVIALICMVSLYLLSSLFQTNSNSYSMSDFVRILGILSIAHVKWSPTYWISGILGDILAPTKAPQMVFATLCLSCLGVLIGFSYLTLKLLHQRAYSNAQNTFSAVRSTSKRSQRVISRLFYFVPPYQRALISKEFRIFSRDMSQALQLMLLLGLCMLYLYNFRLIQSVDGLPQSVRQWWHGILTICNVAMGAFVITAVSTRFVYSSISLEGRAFWILHTSPLTIQQILRAKFWSWYIPVAIITSIVLGSGALAINADVHVVVLTAVSSWLICYGIIGLAIGMGGFFANFSWEHPSQLSASLGSLLFMIASTGLIILNLIPTGLIVFLRSLRNQDYPFSLFDWYTSVGCCAGLLAYINIVTTRWALKMGSESLEKTFN